MKVYTDYVTKNCDYLTAGKRYDLFDFDGRTGHIIDDVGDRIWIRLYRCAHISGRKWKTEQ